MDGQPGRVRGYHRQTGLHGRRLATASTCGRRLPNGCRRTGRSETVGAVERGRAVWSGGASPRGTTSSWWCPNVRSPRPTGRRIICGWRCCICVLLGRRWVLPSVSAASASLCGGSPGHSPGGRVRLVIAPAAPGWFRWSGCREPGQLPVRRQRCHLGAAATHFARCILFLFFFCAVCFLCMFFFLVPNTCDGSKKNVDLFS